MSIDPTYIVRRTAGISNQDGGMETEHALRAAVEPIGATELADRQETTRPTVYRALEPFVEADLLAQNDGFELTDAGAAFLNAYERAVSEVAPAALEWLARSDQRPQLLRTLQRGRARKAELADGPESPSRATVHRAVNSFEQRGWVTRCDGYWLPTAAGNAALEQFDQLCTATEQAVTKADFLDRFGAADQIPLTALADAEQVLPTAERPHALLDASVKAAGIHGEPVDHLRTLVPVFSPVVFSEFESLVDDATTFEVLYTESAFKQLTQPRHIHHLTAGLLASNVDVRVYSDSLAWGIGIYDETVMLAGANETGVHAGVIDQAEPLRSWATETFEHYWQQGSPPSRRFMDWLRTAVPQV